MEPKELVIPTERVKDCIFIIRGHKVMLSTDLAGLYGVEPRVLVQAVKRNIERFPSDFMFQLAKEEFDTLNAQVAISNLKSQTVISSSAGWGGVRRATPYAFTEQGVAMLSSVLKSKQAVLVNIEIMRAFVRLRELLSTHKELARKLASLEKKYDAQFVEVFKAIRHLMEPPDNKKRGRIGFRHE